VFVDEFGFSFAEDLAPTWAPRGQTPILKRVGKFRREVSTMVGLSISGRIFKRHFRGSIKTLQVIEGLEHFHRQVKGPMMVIWDRSPTHRSKLVKSYLKAHPQIRIEALPPYAPQINPEEYCHGNIKQHLKNINPDSVSQILHHLDLGFARLRRRPDMLLGFFHHAGLKLKQLW
jgi:transposase